MTWFCLIAKKGPLFSLEFFCQNAPLCTAINIDQISQCALMLVTIAACDQKKLFQEEQDHRKDGTSGGTSSNVVGIIYLPCWNRVN